jgi:hypothetical protein
MSSLGKHVKRVMKERHVQLMNGMPKRVVEKTRTRDQERIDKNSKRASEKDTLPLSSLRVKSS